ncbi:MAPEG family protein [Roseovarius sp. 2305UL8-3]|uniref:MAPEG family protein n=1 Tax=Roseovarius conchicola TaxID=3121636 RepID=UPI00352792C0
MTLIATPLYAGLLTLLLIILSIRVILARRRSRTLLGDGGDKHLSERIRAQANCTEYAPLGLLLLALCEIQGAPLWSVHFLGALLLLGRTLHAVGLTADGKRLWLRQAGMLATFAMLLLAALGLVGHGVF